MFFPCRHWKPSPAIKFSILVLTSCIALTLWQPAWWPWTVGIVFINHLILIIAGLIPRSTLLGPNITRLPPAAVQRGEVAITIDDGPDPEVTPQVLDILDRFQAKATFFCIGKQAARHPDLCREIIRRGHTIENHSMSHNWYFSLLGPWSIHREVQKAQTILSEISGQVPRFFRATAGLRNPELDPVLAHCGLRLCSWSRRGFDTREKDTDAILKKLVHNLKSGDILLLHDGSAARTPQGIPVILEVLPRLLDIITQSNLYSVTLRSAIPWTNFRQTLLDRATRPYRSAGLFARKFAQGKLRGDPVFFGLLEHGLIPDAGRLIDLGCGQGLLASWLLEAHSMYEAGDWPKDWPAAPKIENIWGLELMPRDVERARAALGDRAQFEQGDIRSADFGQADVAIILDVLHYISYEEQEAVLRRIHAALPKGGTFITRIGDAAGGLSFRYSNWVDHIIFFLRGHGSIPIHCRTTTEWLEVLKRCGFEAYSMPMHEGTPFCSVMLIAKAI